MSRLIDALPDHARVIFLGIVINWPRLRLGLCWAISALIQRGLYPRACRAVEPPDGKPLPAGTGTEAASLRDSLCLLQKAIVSAAILALVS